MKRLTALLMVSLLGMAVPVGAEEDIAARRHFKSSKTKRALGIGRRGMEALFTPVKRGVHYAERVDLPSRIRDFFYNDSYTAAFLPSFSFGGELGGVAGGIDAFHNNLFRKKKSLRGGFLYRDPDALKVRLVYEDPAISESIWQWRLRTEYGRDDEREIFSRGEHLGIFTRSEDETRFGLSRFEGRVEWARRWDRLEAGVYGRGVRGHAEQGRAGSIALPTTLPSLGEVVHLGGGGLQVSWDRRNHRERPTLGSWLAASGGAVGSPDRSGNGPVYRYTEYHAEAMQFFTLFRPRRVLALRSTLERLVPTGNGAIPFYEQPVLDKNHGARNFPRGRFRDRGAVTATAEYRYPIWVSWDAYLFLDAGQTFGPFRQVRSNHMRFSEGFGIRFGSVDRVVFNMVVGLGREKPQIGINFSQVF